MNINSGVDLRISGVIAACSCAVIAVGLGQSQRGAVAGGEGREVYRDTLDAQVFQDHTLRVVMHVASVPLDWARATIQARDKYVAAYLLPPYFYIFPAERRAGTLLYTQRTDNEE